MKSREINALVPQVAAMIMQSIKAAGREKDEYEKTIGNIVLL
jgi:hypothetical protein